MLFSFDCGVDCWWVGLVGLMVCLVFGCGFVAGFPIWNSLRPRTRIRRRLKYPKGHLDERRRVDMREGACGTPKQGGKPPSIQIS